MKKNLSRLFFGFAGLFSLFLFLVNSFAVKKELFKSWDFDTTVRLQDHISRRFDLPFSYFSLFGSAEITTLTLFIFSLALLIVKRKIFWGGIFYFLATIVEIIGKERIVHPAPPFFFLRYDLGYTFPHFYVHTDYSYPSGHMLRTAFILTIFIFLLIKNKTLSVKKIALLFSLFSFGAVMFISRIYLGEHWFSDVVGGLFLGIAASFFALAIY